jgi:hypothetical protein
MVKWFLGEAVRQLSDNALGCRCCPGGCDGDVVDVVIRRVLARHEDEYDSTADSFSQF